MYMRKILFYLFLLTVTGIQANPVDDILERIDKGASRKFQTILVKSDKDFFEIDQKSHPSSNSRKSSSPIIIRGNSWVNIAVGVNWYLKHYAGIHISWNNMTAKIPAVLPRVEKRSAMRQISNCAMISTTAPSPTRWLSGTGTVGRKKSTGWLCMASTCRLPSLAKNVYGETCSSNWAIQRKKLANLLPVLLSWLGGK